MSAEARKRFDAGMGEEEAVRDIALDVYRDWIDDERMIVNVHALYREFGGDQVEPDAGELHGRMLRWRQARRAME